MIKIAIFHYHLLQGGVTNVIKDGIIALFKAGYSNYKIKIVCGKSDNTEKLLEEFKKNFIEETDISIDIIEDIYYTTAGTVSSIKSDELSRLLLNKYGSYIWWIHNYHLGKNPVFTNAILKTAIENPEQKILLQIHDFPECSRYDNLNYLTKNINYPCYPESSNIRYITINSRDKNILEKAGISRNKIFLLNNPVSSNTINNSDKSSIRKKLKDIFKDTYSSFDPDLPVIIYPVRAIRRKNILEAALFTKTMNSCSNLLVTLPGVSVKEKPYSDFCRDLFKNNIIQGIFGAGENIEKHGLSFTDMIAASDMVISSSVQEGFGYLFVNSIQWQIPLIARDLDILKGIKPLFNGLPGCFYSEFRIPADKKTLSNIKSEYINRLKYVSQYLNIKSQKKIRKEIHDLFKNEYLDFSYFSIIDQMNILIKTSSRMFLNDTYDLNKSTIQSFESLISGRYKNTWIDVEPVFGNNAYSKKLLTILRSFSVKNTNKYNKNNIVQDKIIENFAKLEYLRLLYK